jgi:GDP-L-fucose synthase
LKYLFVVPSTLYGPDYHLDGRQMHFIFDVMRKIVDGAERGLPVELWGDGSQRRELVYVGDFVRAMDELSSRYDNDIFNIGSGMEQPIRWYAEKLSEIVGFDPQRIRYDTAKYVGAKSKELVIDKFKRALPEFELTPLDAGLRKTVEWYRSARPAVKPSRLKERE